MGQFACVQVNICWITSARLVTQRLLSLGGETSEVLSSTEHTHSSSLSHTLQKPLPENTYGTCQTLNLCVKAHAACYRAELFDSAFSSS